MVEKIPAYICYGLSGISSLTIGNNVNSIGNYSFYGCSSISSISIPNSVTHIGSYAFSNCSGLVGNLLIPSSITTIKENTFSSCSGLSSISIPNSVTSIESYAFTNCTGLTGNLVIPNSVTSIGSSAFSGTNSITTLIIGENVVNVGSYSFAIPSLTDVVALRERPIIIPNNTFNGVSMVGCDLHVKQGSKERYEIQDVWKDFLIIVEDAEDWADVSGGGSSGVYGDVNGDGYVNAVDVTIIYNILLGNE